jgi:hypothetical protein
MNTDERLARLEGLFQQLLLSDRYFFSKHIQLADSRHIQVGTTYGTQIATSATQQLGFFGATPVPQQGAITAPSGGATVDSQARTAISSMITEIKNLGLTA